MQAESSMDRSVDVSDSSDWLKTPLKALSTVEAALRCQVCKDFYDTPMITLCSHTFCSLCIRRSLTNDGKCPLCRSTEQAKNLRNNSVLQDLVQAFQVARPSILDLGSKVLRDTEDETSVKKLKRKLDETDLEESRNPRISQRKTRSQGRTSSPIRQDTKASEIQQVVGDIEDPGYQHGRLRCTTKRFLWLTTNRRRTGDLSDLPGSNERSPYKSPSRRPRGARQQ